MTKETIKSQSIFPRVDGIQKDVEKLKRLGKLPFEEFAKEENFVRA